MTLRPLLLVLLLLGACATGPGKSSAPVPDPVDSDDGTTDVPTTEPEPEPEPEDDCVEDDEFFADSAMPMLETECIACHGVGGMAEGTRYVLLPSTEPDALASNYAMLTTLVAELGAAGVLDKPTGQTSHGGSVRFDLLDARYAILHELVARIEAPGACSHPGSPPITCTDGAVHPGAAPLRRLTDLQFQTLVADVFAVELPDGLFPATPLGEGFRTAATNNTVSAAGAESILLAAEHVADALDLTTALDCGLSEAECGRAWLLERAEAAWRRPLTEAEQAVLTRFLDAGLSTEDGVRMGVFVLLQAPQALYLDTAILDRVSEGETRDGDVHGLDPHAVASRLSFFLTDGPQTLPSTPR